MHIGRCRRGVPLLSRVRRDAGPRLHLSAFMALHEHELCQFAGLG